MQKTKRQADVYQLLGQLSLRIKEYPKTIEYLQKAINLNPGLTSAYYLIGNTYAAQNDFDAAVNEYKTVIEKNPKAIPSLHDAWHY